MPRRHLPRRGLFTVRALGRILAFASPGLLTAQTPTIASAPDRIVPLELAPAASTLTPTRARSGQAVTLAGTNLRYTGDVALVGHGSAWPVQVWSYNRTTRAMRLTIPRVPVGSYRVQVRNGWGTDTSTGTMQVYQDPITAPVDARQRLQSALRQIVDEHHRRRWLTDADAERLRAKYARGDFTDVQSAMSEMQASMRREAEAAVGGPVADNVLVLALRTGRPVREVAMNWRHCHSLQVGIVEANVTTYRIGPPVQEGQIYGTTCGGPGARWHSHVVPVSISSVGDVATALRTGGRPAAIPPHHHTELRFASGRVWYAPIEDDEWYSDFTDGALYAYDWVSRHSDTIWAGAEILLVVYVAEIGCAAMVLSTGGGGCGPVMVWAATEIAKRVAVILVAEGIVEIPGVPKQAVIAGINAIPPV